jgi:hypothetical protein
VRYELVRQLEVSQFSSGAQLKGASQQGQELLDTEAEGTAPLEAAAKQRSEDHD